MLNLKKILLEVGKKHKVENFTHFGKMRLFRKTKPSLYFAFYDTKEEFGEAKK